MARPIEHQALNTGPTVAVTGGAFTLITRAGRRLTGAVTDGSVSVVNRGNRCTNQTYRVTVASEIGFFEGTLTHRRHAIFGHCIIYAATIRGAGSFSA